jgi:hypothetical protein
VVLLPADLVHSNVNQTVEALGVQFLTDDPLADPPDRVPVDAQEPGDRGLVGLRGQERGHVLEVAGEPGPVAGERDPLYNDTMLRAPQPAQTRPDLDPEPSEVQMSPARPHRPGVVAKPGEQPAMRTLKPAPTQHHLDHQLTGPAVRKRHARYPDTGQVEQMVE